MSLPTFFSSFSQKVPTSSTFLPQNANFESNFSFKEKLGLQESAPFTLYLLGAA